MGKSVYGFPGLRNASHIGRTIRNINSNESTVRKSFGLNKRGYIATKSEKKKDPAFRVYYSKDPLASAKKLFTTIGKGGVQATITNKKTGEIIGWTRKMKGGDVITYRAYKSSDGSPVVDINISNSHTNIKNQKIHFYSMGENK